MPTLMDGVKDPTKETQERLNSQVMIDWLIQLTGGWLIGYFKWLIYCILDWLFG